VRLLLPTGVEGLFFRVFRPLPPPFGPIDDEARLVPWSGLAPGEVIGVPLREDTQTIESLSHDGQQPMDPIVHARLTQAKELAHDDRERISLEIDEEEEQLLLRTRQDPLAASTGAPLAGPVFSGAVLGIPSVIGRSEGVQQESEFLKR
jgi:hypothetical protein